MRIILFLALIYPSLILQAQSTLAPFSSRTIDNNIKTLQVFVPESKLQLPIIELNTADRIVIMFDELSHNAHAYSYKITHCNADWTPSNINSNEYINGFTTGEITNVRLSENTTIQYTNYSLELPNDNMQFKLSGNYAVEIYEDNNSSKPNAIACFSIVEPKVNVTATVRGNTDTELNGSLQQLDFEVYLDGYRIKDPYTEVKVCVRQNNRLDNQLQNLKPTMVSDKKLSYINSKELIFEGGYEYRRFDISSIYVGGAGLDKIRFINPYYNAFLSIDNIRSTSTYQTEQDLNGRYVINIQDAYADDDIEADYMLVNFALKTPQPFFDGQIFVGGEFNHNLLDHNVRLSYDNAQEMYTKSILLKQGGYNYQYWFLPKSATKASVKKIENSYWQTRNEYTIYIYQREWGARYDKLIGVEQIK